MNAELSAGRTDKSTQQRNLELSGRRSDSWYADWGNLLLLALVAYIVLYAGWLLLEWGGETTATLVAEIGYLPVLALGALFATRAAFISRSDRGNRQAWTLIGAGFFFWGFADGLWAYFVLVAGTAPFPSIADLFYVSATLLFFAGVVRFPAVAISVPEWTRYLLDSAIILVGVLALVSYLIIGPEHLREASFPVEVALLLLYPFIDALLIIAVFTMLVRRPQTGSIGVLLLFGAGLLFIAAANLLWSFQESRDAYTFGGWDYILWLIGYGLLVASPQRHCDVVRRGVTSTLPGEFVTRVRGLIPYVGAAVAFAVLLILAAPSLVDDLGLVLIILLVLAGLVLARQVVTLRENADLGVRRAIERSEARFQALVEHSSDLITVVDRNRNCRFQSPSSLEITGFSAGDLIDTDLADWCHPDDRQQLIDALDRVASEAADRARVEWRMHRPEDGITHLETIVSSELENPGVNGLVLNSRDVSERKVLEDELTHLAYHDSLTNLPNRAMFLNKLMRSLRHVEPGRGIGILFLDIDRFKRINDTYGHDTGDQVLLDVAAHIRSALRPEDTVGRIAGDEFTMLLPGLRHEYEAMEIASRVLSKFDTSVPAGVSWTLTVSIGVAFTETPDDDPARLIRSADAAMYAAKRTGRAKAVLFKKGMESEMAANSAMTDSEHHLR